MMKNFQVKRMVLGFAVAVALFLSLPSLAAEDELDPALEARLIAGVRQITFEGKRAGEGYFSADSSKMVFQSERDPENPFYQIFLMDLETGDVERVSPGVGKTTCAWIHPNGRTILFASTHDDPDAKKKQEEELQAREEGTQRRYAWDYDEHFELYAKNMQTGGVMQLTDALGYDAEGSFSPDGSQIAFASNRHAYTEELSKKDAEIFEVDKSYMMDIYIMDATGRNVRRLTTHKGYDGGPFFSPDGKRICWRRFSADGATAEIFTMNTDGTDERQLTELGAMSWAPYYHPSGEYLIFTTNRHGFGNFELYLVKADGEGEPVRVTYTDGFDGLPVLFEDGTRLAWTSNRTAKGQSQIFFGSWNHESALTLLSEGATSDFDDTEVEQRAKDLVAETKTAPAYRPEDIRMHVERLASEEMEGRLTGTRGSRLATAYVAEQFERIGLLPDGDDGTYYQSYEFTAGVSVNRESELHLAAGGEGPEPLALDESWRPLPFTANGSFDQAEVVFAGYGIVAPADEENSVPEYDSFVHLDVTDKFVMVFRYWPEALESKDDEIHYKRFADLRRKAMDVRERGGKGLLVVSGPNSRVEEQLVPLAIDVSLQSSSMYGVSITDDVAQRILDAADKNLAELQDTLDSGEMVMGFELPGVSLSGVLNLDKVNRTGRNTLARLRAVEDKNTEPALVIGAHVDHLGRGQSSNSLARDEEKGEIHYGADDNASGVAGVIEIAEYFADKQRSGDLTLSRDIVFAAWTGEELMTLGSNHFVTELAKRAHDPSNIQTIVAAYLNMDMIGRIDKNLVINGVGSSSIWLREIERRNVPVGLPIVAQNDSYLPTDAIEFYKMGVPILNAFSGAHSEYHTPRDTADLLNYDGATKTARFMGLVARSLAASTDIPDYVEVEAPENEAGRGGMRVYLGTIPDYVVTDIKGVKLSGVTKNAPAEQAGVQANDVVVELAGRTIENIYDYTYAMEDLKPGEETTITVERNGERITLKLVPGSRD